MGERNLGRVNIALYNSYDKLKLTSAHRRALYRAAPVVYSCDFNLVCVDFPLREIQYESVLDLATKLASDTTIGKNGEYLIELASKNRLHFVQSTKKGIASQYGDLIVCTSSPDPTKKISQRRLIENIRRGCTTTFLIGLGRQGLPKEFFMHAAHHFEVTNQNIPFETCSAISAVAIKIFTLLKEYETTPKITVDVILQNEDNEVLLIKRKNYPYKDYWAIPGGFLKYNESVEEAAVREMKEETGFDVELTRVVGVFSTPGRDPRGHVVTVCFLAEIIGGELKADSDAKDVRWIKNIYDIDLAFDHRNILLHSKLS